jgi:hypothetical protein
VGGQWDCQLVDGFFFGFLFLLRAFGMQASVWLFSSFINSYKDKPIYGILDQTRFLPSCFSDGKKGWVFTSSCTILGGYPVMGGYAGNYVIPVVTNLAHFGKFGKCLQIEKS